MMAPDHWQTFAALIFICLSNLSGVSSRAKLVSVNLNTKWKDTPIVLEASEFLAKESNEYFWSFVDDISQMQIDSINYNDFTHYEIVLDVARSLLTSHQVNLLKFALSIRTYSPAVQMHNEIANDRRPPAHCNLFVEVNNMITCELFALGPFIEQAKNQSKPLIIKSDHQYPSSKASDDVFVILYAQLGTNDFSKWHTKLKELANKGEITYILRHYVKNPLNRKVRLSGYGVELAIKSTEYKAKDDTKVEGDKEKREESENDDEDTQGFFFSKLKKLHPELKSNLAEFKQHLIDSTSDLAPLKVWQLQDLSFQAAQKVLSEPKDNQLMMLKDISQNFPSRARSLVKTPVSDEFRREVKRNQKHLENNYGLLPGDSALFINGRQADLDVYDVFTLLETLRSEGKLMEGLFSLGSQFGLSSQDMLQLLMVDLKDAETNYAVDIRDPSVIYINDLERDRRYSGWPSSIQDLLRPTFPGMLRHISKNLFHMVLFVNPADKQSADLLKLAEAFYVHSAPVRIGLVFVVNKDENVDGNTDAGVALVRGFNYIMKQHGAAKALSFLTDVFESAESKIVTSKTVIDEFSNSFSANMDGVFGPNSDFDGRRLIYDKVGHTVLTPEFVADSLTKQFNKEITHDILEPDSEYDILREESANFFERTGLGELPQVLLNGVPLKKEEMQDEFEEAVVRSILRQTGDLQKAVFNGFLRDGMDMLDYVMTRINVMPRLNSRILSTSEKYLDLSQSMPGSLVSKPIVFKSLDSAKMSSAIASSLKYLVKKEEPSARPVTHWVVCDLDVPQGRAFFYEAVKQLKHTNGVRLGVVHNPSAPGGASAKLKISSAIQVALDTLSPNMAKSFITKLLKEENVEALFNGEKSLEDLAVGNMDFDSFNKNLAEYSDDLVESHQIFCGRVLNFGPGERGVVTNGRLIGPLKDGEFFIEEDFTLLEKYTVSASAGKIEKKVKTNKIEEDQVSDLIMKVEALLMSVPQKEARKEVVFHEAEHSIIRIPPKEEGPAFDLVAILDPTTRAAQKYTPFIMVLQKVANMNITVFLNCREKLSEMPLKSYYRFVLEPELDYSADSKEDSSGPFAGFYDMPEKPLLTLGMDPPESWLVQAVHSPYDLDNIFLEEVESIVAADFELEYLLLEGHCYDVLSGNPPRGLQFVLGTNSTPAVVDTIVMANLGYFQLKAVPGLWFLRLREGRSRELYDIVSQDNTDTPSGSTDVIAVIDSFKSKIIRVKVAKKSGKENEDLLSEDEPSMGLWDSISSKFGGGTKDSEDDADLTLNIFSLASGHLYERFLRIMMLSVLKNTKSKVKFWFLKNYLSPSFKDFIPHMAEKYGFEFELVQYKWPRWLHQQTEKQRIIWGYKILFLDVLFPLSVNKFIFVDADQTVRADLKELHDLDLEGAPYGYTPFCESRKEMDGYRFWKSGYWSNHLGHRKYHISALYVVDLKKFRKIAAGDRLRGQYQGLSQDPNSLSNLDQDLPNNMIHQVGIKSLPQEWLWCETWCSDEEKTRAKTIDLCNNPKTKEPKLQAAQRIVAEWVDYDTEIKRLWDEVNNRNITIDTEPETTTPRTDL